MTSNKPSRSRRAERERIEAEEQELPPSAAAEAELEDESNDAPEPVDEPMPVAISDGTDQLALAASLSNVTGSLLTQSREVEQLQAHRCWISRPPLKCLIDLLAAAGIEKSEALKLVKSNQQMMNGLIEDTSLQIRAMQSAVK